MSKIILIIHYIDLNISLLEILSISNILNIGSEKNQNQINDCYENGVGNNSGPSSSE